MNPADLQSLLQRGEALLGRLEALLPAAVPAPDWSALAHRWRSARQPGGRGGLEPVHNLQPIRLADLQDVAPQKARLDANTRQFLRGSYANNALLTGARGTGKSSLVRALLSEYASQGLRVIEVDKADLVELPHIVDLIIARPERFIIFCDDLSFDEAEPGYKALKSVLDGSFAAVPANVLIYATSNRRHLMPEYFAENAATRHVGEEIHPAEAIEEKVSLSDRFGLWLSFYAFGQEEYLRIARHWLESFGVDCGDWAPIRQAALQWSRDRAARSGRVAWQFARDWAGAHAADDGAAP